MNRRKVEWLREFLITQMNHWVVTCVVLSIMILFDSLSPRIYLWALLSVLPFLYYILRVKVKQIALFLPAHLCMPVLALILPMEDMLVKVLVFMLVTGYSGVSVYLKLRSSDGADGVIPPMVAFGIGAAMMLVQENQQADWGGYYILAMLIYIVCYFLCYFSQQYLDFLSLNENSAANIPEKSIFRSGMQQISAFTVGSLLVMLLLANLEWVEWLLDLLRKGIVALIGLLPKGKEASESVSTAQSTLDKTEMGQAALPPGETAEFWIVLEKIAVVILGIGIVAAVIYVLWKVVWYIKSHFKAVDAKKEIGLKDIVDIRESCTIERKQRSKRGLFAFLDNKERIRKTFKKAVLNELQPFGKAEEKAALNYKTAGECCDTMDAALLQQIYEKARYSAEECTAEDVKLAKRS